MRIHQLIALLTFGFSLVFSGCAGSKKVEALEGQKRTGRLSAAVNALLADSGLAGARHGIHVVDLASGDELYGLNNRELFRPASLLKLFTAAAALEMLGPDYRWQTNFMADASQIGEGTLANLTIRASGDPFLTRGQLAAWASEFKARRIDKILNPIKIDFSDFPAPHVPASWEQADTGKDFARQPYPFVLIDSAEEAHAIFQKALADADILVIEKADWKQEGASTKILTHQSAPLSELLPRLLSESENLGAELLLRTTALEKREQGSYDLATTLLQGWIQKQGGVKREPDTSRSKDARGGARSTLPQPLVADGSGLSWRNLLTPDHLTALLANMTGSEHATLFFEAIPVSGQDGTLKFRMREGPLHVRVRAKTGYLPHTRTLAGYMTTAGGRRVAFAVMTENYRVPTSQINALHEQILRAIYESDAADKAAGGAGR